MRNLLRVVILALLVLCLAGSLAGQDEGQKSTNAQDKREKIDQMAQQTLDRLLKQRPWIKRTFEQAVAYAVFNNTKVSVLVTGGGGTGVAVNTSTGDRTYMKMGTGGLGLGLGAQVYQIVFLFETEKTYERFVRSGWEARASANAVAGTAGENLDSSFSNGVAVYQLTQAGLMAQADLSGTKYWKNKRLNAAGPGADVSD